jgi:bifunctional non-homologous end joining protein LigD
LSHNIAKAISGLPAQGAYLDGELCGVLPDGRTAFNLIQNATDARQGSLVYFVFDVLFLDGEDIRELPQGSVGGVPGRCAGSAPV